MRKTPTSSPSLKRNSGNNSGSVNRKQKKRKQFSPRSFLDCQSLTHVVGFPPQNELITTPVASDFVKELFLERFVKEIVKPFQPDKSKKTDEDGKRSTARTTESNTGYYHVMVGGKLVKKRRISQDGIQSNKSTMQSSSEQNQSVDEKLAQKRRIWRESIVIGTNQCLRLLENLNTEHCSENDTKSKAPNKSATTMTKTISDASLPSQKPSLVVLAKDIYPPTMCCAVPVLAKRLGIPLLLLPGKASLELGRALNAKRTSILILCCGNNDALSNSIDSSCKTNAAGEKEPSQHKEISEYRTAIASFLSFIKEQIPQSIS